MKHPKIVKIENVAYAMPVWYAYGHEVTPLSVARTEYHSRRLRAERAEMLKRLAALRALAERRWEENERLSAENREQAAKLQAAAEYDKEIRKRLAHIRKLGKRLASLFEKQSKRLHDCRADRRKWRDTAERCFSSAMKNAVALAEKRKGKRGE